MGSLIVDVLLTEQNLLKSHCNFAPGRVSGLGAVLPQSQTTVYYQFINMDFTLVSRVLSEPIECIIYYNSYLIKSVTSLI